jgi:hypothetical protein
MAFVVADRVKETTTTAGTGTVTLLGASTGFQSFAAVGNTNTTYYTIAGQTGNEWEVGIGTYTSSGTTLARTTVLSNSSGTQPSALSFSAGTKDVFVTYPAEFAAFANGNGVVVENYTALTGTYTMTTGKNGMSVGPITIGSGSSFTVGSGQRWVVL